MLPFVFLPIVFPFAVFPPLALEFRSKLWWSCPKGPASSISILRRPRHLPCPWRRVEASMRLRTVLAAKLAGIFAPETTFYCFQERVFRTLRFEGNSRTRHDCLPCAVVMLPRPACNRCHAAMPLQNHFDHWGSLEPPPKLDC